MQMSPSSCISSKVDLLQLWMQKILWLKNLFLLQMYYHGEEIGVNVHIANSSSRTCKKIKVTSKGIVGKKNTPNLYILFFVCFILFFFFFFVCFFFFPIANFVSTAFERQISQQCSHLFTTCMCLHCGILRKPQALQTFSLELCLSLQYDSLLTSAYFQLHSTSVLWHRQNLSKH